MATKTGFDFRDMFKGATSDETDAKAKAAVAAFRGMQPTLSAYAQMMTGNENVQVVAHPTSNGMTDGQRIYYRPPIGLGANVPHDRTRCDKRGPDRSLLCPACFLREEVLAGIYHEIGHIAGGSFVKPSTEDLADMVVRIGRDYGFGFAKSIAERLTAASGFTDLSQMISPFMHMLWNAVEDSRIDEHMFAARPGMRVMFDAAVHRTMTTGFETKKDGSYSITHWNEQPLNAQVILGAFLLTSGYTYADVLDPRAVEALDDAQIQYLASDTVKNMADAMDSFRLAFKLLVRFRELGFLKSDTDPKEEQNDGPGEEGAPGDPSEADPSSEGKGEGEPTPGDSSGAEQDGDPGPAQEGDGSASGPGTPGGDDSADAGQEPQAGRPEADGGDSDDDAGSPAGDDAGATKPADDAAPGGEASQEGDEGDGDSDVSSSDAKPADGAGSRGEDRQPDERSQGAVDEPQGDLDEPGQSTDGDSSDGDSETGPGESDSAAAGEADADPTGGDVGPGGGTDLGHESPAPTGDSTPGVPDHSGVDGDQQPDTSDEGDAGPGDTSPVPSQDGDLGVSEDGGDKRPADTGDGDGEVVDSGAAASHGTKLINDEIEGLPSQDEMGSADDIAPTVIKIHEEDIPHEIDMKDGESKAVDRAIVQSMWFETGSRNIYMLREHEYGKPTTTLDGVTIDIEWPNLERDGYWRRMSGIEGDFVPGEDILGPALLRMRVAFADNKRSKYDRNRKSGRVDAAVLGRRAWKGDDDRLFGKKVIAKKKDYFVIIGVDISGSTMGTNLVLAKRAAYAQAELCDRLGIKFALYAHTGIYHDGASYGTGMDVEILQVKKPEEPWTDETRKRLVDLPPMLCNLDGHTLEYYRKMADKRPESHVLIMYYTDGKMPAENHDEELVILKREITKCKQNKHTLVGVGIRTDSPREHGLDTVEVSEDADIVKVVRHLESRLLAV